MMRKSPKCAMPPVFVMNPYYTGIGIARNLRHKGPYVYGLSSERNPPGTSSRLYSGIYEVPNGRDEPEALYRRLLEIRKVHVVAPVIFPTRDFDVLFLHQYRDKLTPLYIVPQPGNPSVVLLLDKLEVSDIASRQSLTVPKTIVCCSLEEIERAMISIKFPVIVKPRFAYQWRADGAWEKVGARKAILLESIEDLRTEYPRFASVTSEVMLQEYIPGADTDIVVFCCYIAKDGRLLGHYTAKKLLQTPPLIGTACLVELVDIPEIVEPSLRLLGAVGYVGIAEVEYKHDKSKNKFFLIEVNPRHWDQHELGKLAGVNLTWLTYQDITGGRPLSQSPVYGSTKKCVWIAEREYILFFLRSTYLQLTALWKSGLRMDRRLYRQSLIGLKQIFTELTSILCSFKVLAIFQASDPIPGLLLTLRILRELAEVSVFRLYDRLLHKIDQPQITIKKSG